MASDINSRTRKRPPELRELALRLQSAGDASVPLLVLRQPDFERIAWRDGKRAARRMEMRTTHAFSSAARRALRNGDLTAHDRGSDLFVVAMASPARRTDVPSPIDCRAVLERIAAAMSLETELPIETGWTVIRTLPETDLRAEIERALDRGIADRERYEFLSAIGHELRTPLTSIRGYLETLLEDDLEAKTMQRFLQIARREAMRMGRLIDGMFLFSLLDLSAGALLGSACDVSAQIEAACEVVRPLARRRGVRVRHAACDGAVAQVDADACLQLLVNLIENAIKYGAAGGTVQVSCAISGRDVAIAVDDDGPGIAPAERETIFGLRVRGSRSGDRPGTGIGLAIVKMIAERAGGCIRAGESPLGGARFEASLPLKADSRARLS